MAATVQCIGPYYIPPPSQPSPGEGGDRLEVKKIPRFSPEKQDPSPGSSSCQSNKFRYRPANSHYPLPARVCHRAQWLCDASQRNEVQFRLLPLSPSSVLPCCRNRIVKYLVVDASVSGSCQLGEARITQGWPRHWSLQATSNRSPLRSPRPRATRRGDEEKKGS